MQIKKAALQAPGPIKGQDSNCHDWHRHIHSDCWILYSEKSLICPRMLNRALRRSLSSIERPTLTSLASNHVEPVKVKDNPPDLPPDAFKSPRELRRHLQREEATLYPTGGRYRNLSNYETFIPPIAAPSEKQQPNGESTKDRQADEPDELAGVPKRLSDALKLTLLPRRVRCYNCGMLGHTSLQCTVPQVRKVCNVCGNAGHLSRDCTSSERVDFCYNCKQTGHRTMQCPSRSSSPATISDVRN
jgi:hypothetical protein